MEKIKDFSPGTKFVFKIIAILLFAISMAYLESALVVYLREILAISYSSQMPSAVETAFKIPYFALIKNPLTIIPDVKVLIIEIFREAATIIMLFTFALLVGKKVREKAAIFLLSFAVWDIFYYVFLYVLLGWPASLATLDILFLIPLPWVAPVWVPLLMSTIMIIIAGFLFKHAEIDKTLGRIDRRAERILEKDVRKIKSIERKVEQTISKRKRRRKK
jgi:hypothetical protein